MVLALAVLIYTVADPECVPYIYGRQLELKAAPELSLKHLYTHIYKNGIVFEQLPNEPLTMITNIIKR